MTNATKDLPFACFNGNPPANPHEVEKVQRELSFALPKSYVQFMHEKNGGEGFVGKSYLVLWKVEELISVNAAYHVAQFAPKLFLFGSNGGGEAFGFDTRSGACTIVSVPFVTIEIRDAKTIAPNFEAFLSVLSSS